MSKRVKTLNFAVGKFKYPGDLLTSFNLLEILHLQTQSRLGLPRVGCSRLAAVDDSEEFIATRCRLVESAGDN